MNKHFAMCHLLRVDDAINFHFFCILLNVCMLVETVRSSQALIEC